MRAKNSSRPNWRSMRAPAARRLEGRSVKAMAWTAITAPKVRILITSISCRCSARASATARERSHPVLGALGESPERLLGPASRTAAPVAYHGPVKLPLTGDAAAAQLLQVDPLA